MMILTGAKHVNYSDNILNGFGFVILIMHKETNMTDILSVNINKDMQLVFILNDIFERRRERIKGNDCFL